MKNSTPSYAVSPHDIPGEKYVNTLNNWSIDQRHRKKRIGIVGAGMSGLTAGWLLSQAGHEVRLFEANKFVGGRIRTLRNGFTGNLYAEAGAMRIPQSHQLTNWFIKHFDLQTTPFLTKSSAAPVYFNNQRTTTSELQLNNVSLGFDISETEAKYSATDMFEVSVLNYFRDELGVTNFPKEGGFGTKLDNYLLEKLDKYSLLEFLIDKARLNGKSLTQEAIDKITALLNMEMHLSVSMASILNDYFELTDRENLFQIIGGMDQLPKGFMDADNVGPFSMKNVKFGSRVIEILNQDSSLRVCYENPETHIHDGYDDFDIVLLSLPFSAMHHIRMKNLMSQQKRRAVRQLHYDNSCKIILEFSDRYWKNPDILSEVIGAGGSITDLPLRQVFFPVEEQIDHVSGHSVVLASYTWGDASLRWTSLSKDDRIRFAIRDLERLHGVRDGVLGNICVGGMSFSWAEDSYTSGAFAMFEPFQYTRLFNDVWRPEGRLHYCGEHTSTKHGWIEGAIESGVRAALEICNRFEIESVGE